MATITTSQFLDGGTARTAGEAMAIGNGATLTIRTDTRIHANAPASFTGSLSSPTFTNIGGELFIDATAVRWLAYSSGTGNAPAIGTSITQGGVSGYYLGCWGSIGGAPVAVGAAIPATGFIKLREVTGGTYSAGALGGISASASGADVPGWIEVVWDDATNFVVGRVGKIKSRGDWFEIGTTTGSVGQVLTMPTTSSTSTNNYPSGIWVETSSGSGTYEYWPGLSSAANMWIKTAIGFAEGSTDRRGRFVKSFGNGQVQFGETSTMTGTYATVTGQASTYAGIAISSTYTLTSNVVTVNTGATAHLFEDGQQVYLDFTSGTAVDGTYTVTVLDAYNFSVPLVGSNTSGNVTVRPGVTVTFTAHGYNEGEDVYCDFTSGSGVDGTYKIYAVTGANTYNVAYPHTAALTSGNVTIQGRLQVTITSHGMALGNEVYLDFTSGTGVDGKYIMRAVATNTFDINYPFATAITSSNVTARWTIGHVPPTGCKVRIPNIIMAACATASRATNSVPNATIATRPEFNTSTAGAIDLWNIYAINLRSIFAQPYSISLRYCSFQETLDISECATALDIVDVGVGSYSAQDVRAIQLTSNFAGGTLSKLVSWRPTIGTTDHAMEIIYCSGQTFDDIDAGIIGYARSTGIALNIAGSSNITLSNLRVSNGNVPIANSLNVTINDIDYCDRVIGHTNSTTPYYMVTVGAGCADITIDGVSFGLGNTIPDCHPYTGILNTTNAARVKLRNVGSSSSYLQTGVWAPNIYGLGTAIVSGGNNNTLKFQKIFLGKLRTAILSTINSDKNVLVEQTVSTYPWLHSAKAARTETLAWLNADIKGVTTGVELTTGQTSVYGSHFYSLFRGGVFGSIVLAMNEPTAESTAQYSNVSGVVKFNSSGGVEMRAIGAQSIWEMNYFAKGHTGFANVTPVMSGGTIGNYTLEYQIDAGSGWNGTWKTLNTTNLTAEVVDAGTGFKLKVRVTTSTTNTTAITFLRIYTTTTTTAQNAIDYPLDTVSFELTGLKPGSEIRAYLGTDPATAVELAGVESSGTSFSFNHAVAGQQGYIQIHSTGYRFINLPITYSSSNVSIPIQQESDRWFQNP